MKARGQINPQRNVTDSSEGRQQATEVTGGGEGLGFPNSLEHSLHGNISRASGGVGRRSDARPQCFAAAPIGRGPAANLWVPGF